MNRTMIRFLMCLIFAVFAIATPEDYDWAAPNENAPTEPPLKDGMKCDIESYNKITCKNDRLIFCGPSNQIVSTPCKVNGRPGFCNCEKTGCVAKKPTCGEDTDCLTPTTKLPDNLDCRNFTYCDENKKKVMLQCPNRLVYDPNTQQCTDKSATKCAKVACPRESDALRLIPFPQAPNYYVLCYQGMGDVRKCSDKFYAVQNNACKFDCRMKKKTGLFRDTNIERCKAGIFYVCAKSGGTYVTKQAQCSSGKYFDENIKICTSTDTCEQSANPPQS